jgi:outer membrane lipoprotein SlyB
MHKSLLLFPMVAGLALSGCANMPGTKTAVPASMSFQTTSANEAVLLEQTATLDRMMKDIVRHTTIKHAAVGAAIGCGLAVVTSSASSCLTAAAAGGAVGAVSGHLAGKRDVTQRIELVSANSIVRSIRKSNTQLGDINADLPKFLAQQDADVKGLTSLRTMGTISTEEFDARLAMIRTNRAELAEALLMSSQQARTASANLREAAAQGQSGLEWHISAVDQMEREALSARSSIALL